jgi:hypothetical protein
LTIKWNNVPVPFLKREFLRGEIAAMFSLALDASGVASELMKQMPQF